MINRKSESLLLHNFYRLRYVPKWVLKKLEIKKSKI